jgi:hypothetical protein
VTSIEYVQSFVAIYQQHIGNEAHAEITLAKAEKLQRALLKADEEQNTSTNNVAAASTSPITEEKRAGTVMEDEDKEKLPVGDEKGEQYTSAHEDLLQ